MPAPRTRKLASLALGTVVLVFLWVYLAPAAIGGSTSYVVTDGISMEPRFHSGDLALVRSRSVYHVGEIVAYYNKAFHTVVLHRIVARDGSRYVFKGDNNNFLDFEHPTRSQLIGALWLHLPGVGGTLESIRSPALIAGLVMLGALLFLGGAFTRQRRRRRRQARAGMAAAPLVGRPRPTLSRESLGGLVALLAFALIPFAVIALLAFTRPSSKPVPFSVAYQQKGTLSYTAYARPGPTYARNIAVTGEPLFSRVLNTAQMHFAYELQAPEAREFTGVGSMYAEIESTSGWRTSVLLGHPVHFRGPRGVIDAPLPLHSLLALVQSVEATTGIGGSYTLTITPRVNVSGSVSAHPLRTSFSPPSKFALTPLELKPFAHASGSLTEPSSPTSQFTQTKSGSLAGKHSEPLSLSFGVGRLTVGAARALALGGIVLLAMALMALLSLVRPVVRDEVETIRARYSRYIVPVARVATLPGVSVIDVADMDALVRIAEHYDRSILHETSAGVDAFWVTDESGQFRYAVGAGSTVSAPTPTPMPTPIFAAPPERAEADTTEFAVLSVDAPVEPGSPAPAAVTNGNGVAHSAELLLGGAVGGANGIEPAVNGASAVTNGTGNGDHAMASVQQGGYDDAVYASAFGASGSTGVSDADYAAAFGRPTFASPSQPFAGSGQAREGDLAEEVYADEMELGVLDYDSSADGNPNAPNTSPSLPAWTGSSG
jgi:signal peptidase I